MINNKIIKEFFDGKIKLWKSYWLVGELLNSSVSQIPFLDFSNLTILSKVIIFLWTVFISIGIWRAAENYKGSIIWIILTFIIVAYRCYSLRLIFFI